MEQWLYQCAGMHILHGTTHKATNGFIGVTTNGELVLLDNEGTEFDRAPVADVRIIIGAWSAFKMNHHGYAVEFHPFTQEASEATLNTAVAGWSNQPDPRSEEEKRSQLAQLIKRIQQS